MAPTLTTGGRAFFRAYSHTLGRGRPIARAVRTWSCDSTSSMHSDRRRSLYALSRTVSWLYLTSFAVIFCPLWK